jgi:hypothetical protein
MYDMKGTLGTDVESKNKGNSDVFLQRYLNLPDSLE